MEFGDNWYIIGTLLVDNWYIISIQTYDLPIWYPKCTCNVRTFQYHQAEWVNKLWQAKMFS